MNTNNFRRGKFSSACIFAVATVLITGASSARAIEVVATNFVQKNIYHSPETPGYTAWCALWRAKDEHLRVAFQQVTGPVTNRNQRTNATVILDSPDNGATWNKLREVQARQHTNDLSEIYAAPASAKFCGHGLVALPDGTLVAGLWGKTGEEFGYVQRSEDDGKTWSKPIFFRGQKIVSNLAFTDSSVARRAFNSFRRGGETEARRKGYEQNVEGDV